MKEDKLKKAVDVGVKTIDVSKLITPLTLAPKIKMLGKLQREVEELSLSISKDTSASQSEIISRAINIAQSTTNNIIESLYIVKNQILKENLEGKR